VRASAEDLAEVRLNRVTADLPAVSPAGRSSSP
jgi:hypothetical protein